MRISDWSSDVCSSDLHGPRATGQGDEVPDARFEHEPQWIDRAPHLAVALRVAQLDPALLPHRTRERREVGDGLLASEPAGGVEVEALAHAHRPAPQPG